MPQVSAGGYVLILALLNAWLAARCGRSSFGWFLASLLLAPLVWLLTLYLVTRPRVPADTSSAPRGPITILALVLAAFVMGWAVLLAAGPTSGAVLTTGGLGHEEVPPASMTISVPNGTSLTVTLVMNGGVAQTIGPGVESATAGSCHAGWTAAIRTRSITYR